MRSDTVAVLDATLRRSPLHTYFRRRSARSLVVLAYHGVDDPDQLDRHLQRLSRSADPVSLTDVLAAMDGGPALPDRSVLVTFDDGAPSVLEHGAPLLRRHAVPAVAFVVPGVIDSTRAHWWVEAGELCRAGARVDGQPGSTPDAVVRWMKTIPDHWRVAVLDELRSTAGRPAEPAMQLTSDQLTELEAAGIAVENHTWSHPLLDQCSEETIEAEVTRAHRWLEEKLGRPPRAFAYPNGNWDRRAEEVLVALGYQAAFLFDHKLSDRVPAHPRRVSRVRVDSTTSSARFDLIVSGLHPALHHLRGRS
jgi:peptidoglycan/xylan/chitin deacetylase (PgdA/CDA1 family)